MAQQIGANPAAQSSLADTSLVHKPVQEAFQILHWGFAALPILAGLDKFAHILVNWDQYLAPVIPQTLHISGHTFMLVVGVIEIIAGLAVAIKPKIGAY